MPISRLTSYEQYHELSSGREPLVIEFWAAWCPSCNHIAQTFEALSNQVPELQFLTVDVDDKEFGYEFSRAHGIRAMPTFRIIQEGVTIVELVGADQDKLRPLIEEFLGKLH